MGTYIKGMKAPKECAKCPVALSIVAGCDAFFTDNRPEGKTRNDCPLIEVPEPHGSLVDADERLTFNLFDVENEEYSQKSISIYEALVLWAEQMPKTVIEAEGE